MKRLLTHLLLRSSGRIVAAAVLLAATLTMPAPLAELDNARHTYLIQGDGAPAYIYGTAQEEADYGFLTAAPNRSELIGDAQLCLSGDQTVTVTAGDRTETLAVTVTDTWRYDWSETFPTTYTTQRVANRSMVKGKERVKQEGQDGSYTEIHADLYTVDGYLEEAFFHRGLDTSVPEIIEYGTAAPAATVRQSARIAEVHPNEDGTPGGFLVLSTGETVAYTGVDTYEATAYCIHGTTATGYPTAMGVVAVDPRVIPYGTRMFIQTPSGSWVYGTAVARDCGGAIKGKIIDLWFPDYATCAQWGRRNITVYFLG